MSMYHFLSDNPLKTRDDVAASLIAILDQCVDHLTPEGAGLAVGGSSAHYSGHVALFEGWSRLLWGVVPLRLGGYVWKGEDRHGQGFMAGPDPLNVEYWGAVQDHDQRIVEMAAMSLALLLCRNEYWDSLTESQRKNLSSWLYSVNGKAIGENNWHYFRILVNLALQNLGEPYDQTQMEADLDFIDGLYVGDGWYRDDVPFDYYNPFAIHFYSLIYYAYMRECDSVRCERYRERVIKFAKQYVTYYAAEGQSIPFGRSQTYRFAVVSFFSACAFAGIEVLPWGVLKGLVLRNLRWWFSKPIFDNAGLLTIGYAYPSLIVADEYNAPGSPYWALKTYLVLALGDDHPFWKSEEQDMPVLPTVTHLPVPKVLMCHTCQKDVVMLSAGQYPAFELNHAAEKYSKFAYSTDFGFSVSISPFGFDKTGCDSMLFFSEGDGYWRPRRKVEYCLSTDEQLYSRWSPFPDVVVRTWLFPAGDWHVRIHMVSSKRDVVMKEGGFGIMRYDGIQPDVGFEQTFFSNGHGLEIKLPWGVSVVEDLLGVRMAECVKPRPNLNLMFSTSVVPVLNSGCRSDETVMLATLVGAGLYRKGVPSITRTKPEVHVDVAKSYIEINGKQVVLFTE